MKLTPAERHWVRALRHRQSGRLAAALAQCEAARRLQAASPRQLAFQADIEASLGLTFRAARTTLLAAREDRSLRLCSARRLWQASLFRAAQRQASQAAPCSEASALAARCRALLARKASLPEPRVVLDPRLQLAGVVGALAAGRGLATGFSLTEPARRWFSRHRGHPAVRLYRQAARAGLSAVGIQRSLLSPDLSQPRHAGLLASMEDFARRARLDGFLTSQRPLYAPIVRRLDREARRLRYARLFARYTGQIPAARYEISLCPFHAPGASARLNHLGRPGADGRYRIVTTLAAPFAYAPLAWSIWHELAHALTDHWLEGHEDSLDRSRRALPAASASRFGSWEQSVREHVVQGLATRMVRWSAAAPRPDGDGADEALPYLEQVSGALARYDGSRRRYRTLESFYPSLLRLFERIAADARADAREGRSRRAQADGA